MRGEGTKLVSNFKGDGTRSQGFRVGVLEAVPIGRYPLQLGGFLETLFWLNWAVGSSGLAGTVSGIP